MKPKDKFLKAARKEVKTYKGKTIQMTVDFSLGIRMSEGCGIVFFIFLPFYLLAPFEFPNTCILDFLFAFSMFFLFSFFNLFCIFHLLPFLLAFTWTFSSDLAAH